MLLERERREGKKSTSSGIIRGDVTGCESVGSSLREGIIVDVERRGYCRCVRGCDEGKSVSSERDGSEE